MKGKSAKAAAAMLLALAVAQAAAVEVEVVVIENPAADDKAAANENTAGGIEYEERRVGGRLEQVIVPRENGFTEVYRNNRGDTLWNAQENEIGEVPNKRRWVIGTW